MGKSTPHGTTTRIATLPLQTMTRYSRIDRERANVRVGAELHQIDGGIAMRRSLAVLMLVFGMLIGSGAAPGATTAMQQDQATPAPGATRARPVIGDSVNYISESGSEIGSLKVTEMVRPWDEFGEYYAPDSGTEYVAFVIEVTHLGSRGDLIVRADDFRLQDVDGFLYSRAWVDSGSGAEYVPSDPEIGIAPGETAEIIVVYQVLSGVDLSAVFWQPDYQRLITLADLIEEP
jgi:hypothetical protein